MVVVVVEGVWRWGKREIIYLSQHCHYQNAFCIKVGSDENHFNVSLIIRDKVTRQCPQTTTFEEKREPKRIRSEVPLLHQPNALPLGQTSSRLPPDDVASDVGLTYLGTNCDQCVCMVQLCFTSTETIGSLGRPPRLSHSS